MQVNKNAMRQCLAAALIGLAALPAHAQSIDPAPPANRQAPELDQVVYKGVVGNLLDRVPMEPEERLGLQRANAVIGNPFSARTVAIVLGAATAAPILMIGGLAWGIFAASRIKPAKRAAPLQLASGQCGEEWMPMADAAPVGPVSEVAVISPRDDVATAQR